MSVVGPSQLVRLDRVSLTELNERAELLDRAENKYVIGFHDLNEAIDELCEHFDVLEIDDRLVFTYETTYYDTDSLVTYRQHVQGKRRRLKIRSRRYVDSDRCFFEVKLKGRRGRTIKERIAYDGDRHGTIDPEAISFVDRCVRRHYGAGFVHHLAPALTMRYQRVTLVGRASPERATADFALEFLRPGGHWVPASDDAVIVEVKSPHGDGRADHALRAAGHRPTSCSKYCVGLNFIRDDVGYNQFKATLTEHFDWSPPSPHADEDLVGTRPTQAALRDRNAWPWPGGRAEVAV